MLTIAAPDSSPSAQALSLLGEAGLLDGRRATTHWHHVERLQSRFPLAEIVPDVLYVEDGQVLTSAGSAAGIDLCLHVVRSDFGTAVANTVARRLVLPAHRSGGQAQYLDKPVSTGGHALSPMLEWVIEHLTEGHTVSSPGPAGRVLRAQPAAQIQIGDWSVAHALGH